MHCREPRVRLPGASGSGPIPWSQRPRSFTTFYRELANIRLCIAKPLPSRKARFGAFSATDRSSFRAGSRPRMTAKKWRGSMQGGIPGRPSEAQGAANAASCSRQPSLALRVSLLTGTGPKGVTQPGARLNDAQKVAVSGKGFPAPALMRTRRQTALALRFAPLAVLSPGPRLAGMPSKGVEM